MSQYLAWALGRAREHTLALVGDVPEERMNWQSVAEERHPAWLLGHLALADTYLLFLLGVQPLEGDFQSLLQQYGPKSVPTSHSRYHTKHDLIERLSGTNDLRIARIRTMNDRDLAEPMPDRMLAAAQPTIGHHLCALVFHEGYHGGQLSSWRKAHGFAAVAWTLGPRPRIVKPDTNDGSEI